MGIHQAPSSTLKNIADKKDDVKTNEKIKTRKQLGQFESSRHGNEVGLVLPAFYRPKLAHKS